MKQATILHVLLVEGEDVSLWEHKSKMKQCPSILQ